MVTSQRNTQGAGIGKTAPSFTVGWAVPYVDGLQRHNPLGGSSAEFHGIMANQDVRFAMMDGSASSYVGGSFEKDYGAHVRAKSSLQQSLSRAQIPEA